MLISLEKYLFGALKEFYVLIKKILLALKK